jgi:hypothetical protein
MLLTSFLPLPIPPLANRCLLVAELSPQTAQRFTTALSQQQQPPSTACKLIKTKNGLDSKIHQLEFSGVLAGYELCTLRLALPSFYGHKPLATQLS